MCNFVFKPILNLLLVLCFSWESTAWITLSQQGLTINKTHLNMQSGAVVEGDLLVKGALRASDYTWISGLDAAEQDVCNSNNVGSLRWRNSTHDFFDGCDSSGNWAQVSFCDKDCGFPSFPPSKVRSFVAGGPTDCQAEVCTINCSFDRINPIFVDSILSISAVHLTLDGVRQQCSQIISLHNGSGTCSNVTFQEFYSFVGQPVSQYFIPKDVICFATTSFTCRHENCPDRLIQDVGWKSQRGISGTRWILLKDPSVPAKDPLAQVFKLARENDLYYYEGIFYPMSITLHDLITYDEPGTQIWPSASLAKLPVELWRNDYLSNEGIVGSAFRSTAFLYQGRISSVFDEDAVLQPSINNPLTCASLNFRAQAFDYLGIFYNVSGWEQLLPLTPPIDESTSESAVPVQTHPQFLTACFGGLQHSVPPPFWLLAERDAAENSSWVGTVASGPPVVCINGTCSGMNCSVVLLAPQGFAVQVRASVLP